MIRTYSVLIEDAGANYSAYVPDLPGCVATGATYEEALQQIREAIEFHLEGMKILGITIPKPTTQTDSVDVQVA